MGNAFRPARLPLASVSRPRKFFASWVSMKTQSAISPNAESSDHGPAQQSDAADQNEAGRAEENDEGLPIGLIPVAAHEAAERKVQRERSDADQGQADGEHPRGHAHEFRIE